MMKKRVVLLLSVVFMFSMTVLSSTIFVSANTESTGDTLVSFICDSDETALNKAESSAIGEGGIIPYSGDANGTSKRTELYCENAYGVYDFNFADNVTEAYLNIISDNFKIEYKADGETDYTLLSTLSVDKFGISSLKLDVTNALKNETNAFKLKFTNIAAGQMNLHMISVTAKEHKIVSDVKFIDTNSISGGLPYLLDSDGSFTYWDGAADKGFIHGNGQAQEIIYRFNLDSTAMPKVKLIEPVLDGGVSATWQYSTDSVTYRNYVAGTELETSGGNEIYVKITTEAGNRLLVKGLGIENAAQAGGDLIANGVNANINIPANEAETYFKVGDGNEKKHMFGVATDYKTEFNSAHGGLVRDGHEGGWPSTMPENARKLTAGQYVAYDFDLKNAITSAKLKIHAGPNIKVLVSSDEGDTAHILTTTNIPGGRGMYIFDLTVADALANTNNKFRVAIQGVSESYLFALMVHEDSTETISGGTSLKPWSRDGLRYLIETKNVHAYYGLGRYQNYFFNGENSYAIFKVAFDSTVTDPIFFVNQCGSVKVELSGDGVNYTSVISKLLGGTGDVPYNTFDAKSYLGENKAVYVKLTNVNKEGGFVHDAGFASASALASGTIEMDTLPNYLHSVSNKENIGTLKATDANGGKGFLLEGDISFKVKYDGEANGIKLAVSGISGTGTLYISKNGTDFEMIGSLKEGNFSVIDYLSVKDNADKVLYVKLSGADFVFDKIAYTTVGIEMEGDKSKPYDDDMTFDYDKTLPSVDSYGKPTLNLPNTPESKLAFNKALVIGLSVGGGSILLLGGGFTVIWFLVIKKKGGAK